MNYSYIVLSVFLMACSSPTKNLSKTKNSQSGQVAYSKEFVTKVDKIRKTYKKGNSKVVIRSLAAIKDSSLKKEEVAYKKNLMGVIYFSDGKNELAIKEFKDALKHSETDPVLTSQIYLNLSSCYYKTSEADQGLNSLAQIDTNKLTDKERANFYRLKLEMEIQKNQRPEAMRTLFTIMSELKSIEAITGHVDNAKFEELYASLSDAEVLKILNDESNAHYLIINYLAFKKASQFEAQKDTARATQLLTYLKSKQESLFDLKLKVDELEKKLGVVEIQKIASPVKEENIKNVSTKIEIPNLPLDKNVIGVVLPLSGDKKKFSDRAIEGIEFALKTVIGKINPEAKVIIKDSQSNGTIGGQMVQELIQKDKAGIIIAGLFSDESKKEYIEARNLGALFVSLSPVPLPVTEKNDHLIVVPASIESQVKYVLSDDFLSKMGKRVAVLYPKDDLGKEYAELFFTEAKAKGVIITDFQSFEPNSTDYREAMKPILGLRDRMRVEEKDLVRSIRENEKKTSKALTANTVPASTSFDWVFIPTFPQNASVIIPTFAYFDAVKLNIVGTPSWNASSMIPMASRGSMVYFAGEDVQLKQNMFDEEFVKTYQKAPRIVEINGYDSLNILKPLFRKDYSSTYELRDALNSIGGLTGISGEWRQENGQWIKKMYSFKVTSNGIRKLEGQE